MTGREKRPFRIELILSIATLILVAALLGFEVWKYYQPSSDGLADKVRTSMNQYLSQGQQFRNSSAQVTTITVMHAAENMFEGLATVTASGTTEHQVSVHIVYDGSTMSWRTDSGAFLFLVSNS